VNPCLFGYLSIVQDSSQVVTDLPSETVSYLANESVG
jgi:hypothetical protein